MLLSYFSFPVRVLVLIAVVAAMEVAVTLTVVLLSYPI